MTDAMGLFDKLRTELIDIVEWIDDSHHTLVWRFPRHQNQIKQGAKLIVRPGQVAVFVHQGKLADVFEPGTWELKTGNLPILSTLAGWKHGFDSPIKCEVYFVATRQITDLKWGTPNPVMLRDPDFGPIRLRAFGHYSMKAVDPKALLTELVGTDGRFEADEISELIRSMINSSFADVVAESQVAALDLATRYRELSEALRVAVVERVDDEYGLDLPQLTIVNISLPEAVEDALDTRTSMGVIGDMGRYQQYRMADAMTKAAENPGGGAAGEGMGLGMGLAMAGQMMQGMNQGMAPPPPMPPAAAWHIASGGATQGPFTLAQLTQMATAGQINRETMVWTSGMNGWMAAGQVPAFASVFGAVPPPPPPMS